MSICDVKRLDMNLQTPILPVLAPFKLHHHQPCFQQEEAAVISGKKSSDKPTIYTKLLTDDVSNELVNEMERLPRYFHKELVETKMGGKKDLNLLGGWKLQGMLTVQMLAISHLR